MIRNFVGKKFINSATHINMIDEVLDVTSICIVYIEVILICLIVTLAHRYNAIYTIYRSTKLFLCITMNKSLVIVNIGHRMNCVRDGSCRVQLNALPSLLHRSCYHLAHYGSFLKNNGNTGI